MSDANCPVCLQPVILAGVMHRRCTRQVTENANRLLGFVRYAAGADRLKGTPEDLMKEFRSVAQGARGLLRRFGSDVSQSHEGPARPVEGSNPCRD